MQIIDLSDPSSIETFLANIAWLIWNPRHIDNMKNFKSSDVQNSDSAFPRIYLGKYAEELKDSPLWWHRQGLSQTASGYGAKLTLRYKISYEGREFRLYATCYGNAASTWFKVKGRKIFVD